MFAFASRCAMSARRLAAAAFGIVLLASFALLPRLLESGGDAAEAGAVAPFALSIDCDTAAAGIQSNCSLPAGTAALGIDVVFSNNGETATTLGAVQFTVRATPQQ